jgi:hypothetical protein
MLMDHWVSAMRAAIALRFAGCDRAIGCHVTLAGRSRPTGFFCQAPALQTETNNKTIYAVLYAKIYLNTATYWRMPRKGISHMNNIAAIFATGTPAA